MSFEAGELLRVHSGLVFGLLARGVLGTAILVPLVRTALAMAADREALKKACDVAAMLRIVPRSNGFRAFARSLPTIERASSARRPRLLAAALARDLRGPRAFAWLVCLTYVGWSVAGGLGAGAIVKASVLVGGFRAISTAPVDLRAAMVSALLVDVDTPLVLGVLSAGVGLVCSSWVVALLLFLDGARNRRTALAAALRVALVPADAADREPLDATMRSRPGKYRPLALGLSALCLVLGAAVPVRTPVSLLDAVYYFQERPIPTTRALNADGAASVVLASSAVRGPLAPGPRIPVSIGQNGIFFRSSAVRDVATQDIDPPQRDAPRDRFGCAGAAWDDCPYPASMSYPALQDRMAEASEALGRVASRRHIRPFLFVVDAAQPFSRVSPGFVAAYNVGHRYVQAATRVAGKENLAAVLQIELVGPSELQVADAPLQDCGGGPEPLLIDPAVAWQRVIDVATAVFRDEVALMVAAPMDHSAIPLLHTACYRIVR